MKKVYYNGKVYVEKGVYAEAFLVEDGVFKIVGKNEEVLRAGGDCEKYDLGGKTVVPGFNDSHCHLSYKGVDMLYPNLLDVKNCDEIVERLKEYLAKHPNAQKIDIGCGWNEDLMEEGSRRVPNRYDLDKVSTEIPIIVSRICGHSSAVNSKLLEMMGLKKGNTDIPGGRCDVDENGEPIGVVYENGNGLARSFLPKNSFEEVKEGFEIVSKYAVEHGMTSCQSQDLGNDYEQADLYYEAIKAAIAEGTSKLRWRAQVGANTVEGIKRYVEGPHFMESLYNDHFNMGGLKMFKDGSLGARSGLTRHGYADDPGNLGVTVIEDGPQYEMVKYAEDHNLQVLTHVICDGAIERTVNIYEKAMNGRANRNRHCLIHCQITDKKMIEDIKRNDILVGAQPVFLEYDLHITDDRVGKAMGATSYATKTANDLGIHIAYGTDCPVEDCNPMCGIYCAVTRKDYNHQPEGGWNPQECVDVETAIDNYTIDSAYQEFRENVKGRIKPAYYADFVVLDKDIFTCDPDEILDILPVLTVIGGEVAYEK